MELNPEKFYKILSPRISALITTQDKEGKTNAAPFSFLMPISMEPPLVAFSCGHGKDTLKNSLETKEFVLNLVSEENLSHVWTCSKKFPKQTSELEKANLTPRETQKVKPPGIEQCWGWLECKVIFHKELGDHVLVVGEVLKAEIKENCLKKNGNLNLEKIKPLFHLGGEEFAVPQEEILIAGSDAP